MSGTRRPRPDCFWPTGEPLQFGTKVRTTCDAGGEDWTDTMARRWGVDGVVVDRSDAHGLCYCVRYTDGSEGWFDPAELAMI